MSKKKAPLVILQDTREQRGLGGTQECRELLEGQPCGARAPIGACPRCRVQAPRRTILAQRVFGSDVVVEAGTLFAGDYTVADFDGDVGVERKSGADLLGTLHGGHERFNRELARFREYRRVAIVVDDAWSAEGIVERHGGSREDAIVLAKVIKTIEWKGRIPVFFAGTRERAARIAEKMLLEARNELGEPKMTAARAAMLNLPPPSTPIGLVVRALCIDYGICRCGRRLPQRPKPQGPGVCECGRKARGSASEESEDE